MHGPVDSEHASRGYRVWRTCELTLNEIGRSLTVTCTSGESLLLLLLVVVVVLVAGLAAALLLILVDIFFGLCRRWSQ